jgi:hypothetical protein
MMTMWCMFRSPLILGGDVTALSDFENGLITNRELIDIDQNSSDCRQVSADADSIVYFAEQPAKHRKYVALFNVSEGNRQVACSLEQMGLVGPFEVREIWSGRDLGVCSGEISSTVDAHGVALFALTPP